jgi:ubiquinone biosynthesis protein UbiJ
MGELTGGHSDPARFADSMAAAIEDELNKLLAEDGKQTLPGDGTTDVARDRRRFIAAISRGVIRHLMEHADALTVDFTAVPSPHSVADFSAQVQVHAGDVP